jgi:hypothetical protein
VAIDKRRPSAAEAALLLDSCGTAEGALTKKRRCHTDSKAPPLLTDGKAEMREMRRLWPAVPGGARRAAVRIVAFVVMCPTLRVARLGARCQGVVVVVILGGCQG